MPIVKVLRGGQVTLPAEMRQRLGLREGAELLVTVGGDRSLWLRVLPQPGDLDDLVGCLRPAAAADEVEARIEAREEVADRFEEETARALAQERTGRGEQAAARA